MNIEIVEWGDAWCKEGELAISSLDAEPYSTISVGVVLKETLTGLLLTQEVWPEDPGSCYSCTFIPIGMITKRQKVGELPDIYLVSPSALELRPVTVSGDLH